MVVKFASADYSVAKNVLEDVLFADILTSAQSKGIINTLRWLEEHEEESLARQ